MGNPGGDRRGQILGNQAGTRDESQGYNNNSVLKICHQEGMGATEWLNADNP